MTPSCGPGSTEPAANSAAPPGNGELAWDQFQVEAVINAVNGGEAGERVVELVVLIDHDTLADGLHANSVCELSDGQAVAGLDGAPVGV